VKAAEARPPAEADRPVPALGRWERRYLMVVAAFTLYVAFWGLLFPGGLGVDLPGLAKDFNHALPFNLVIPPLHARFIGALYLGASVFLLLALRRGQTWREQRIGLWMVLLWTGMLELISLLHLEIFDWHRQPARPLVAWWLAYTWFPLQAAWILWRRGDRPLAAAAPAEDGPGRGSRRGLTLLGWALVALAFLLFLAPESSAALWPWKLPPILAQVYSGPFLALGWGALLAARTASGGERAGYLWAALTFALAALAASARHRDLFDFHRAGPWIWFGGLLLAAAFLLPAALAVRRSPR